MKDQFDVIYIDGSGYLFRAFHALPALTNKEGMPTGAVYGVINMIKRLEKAHKDVPIVVVFDPPGPTKRHEVYADYKANRTKMPDDLRVQIAPLHAIIRGLGLPLIIVDQYEADDVIGTLATRSANEGKRVLISTQDKDFAQLVNDRITIVDTMHNKVYDAAGVEAKFQIGPQLIIDYLALIGDSSDNIPGVEKVGPKTAVKWLQAYGSLENLLAHKDEIGGKVGDNLRNSVDNLALYKALVTIDTAVEVDFNGCMYTRSLPDVEVLEHWYVNLGFRTWYAQLTINKKTKVDRYTLVSDENALMSMCQSLGTHDDPIALSIFYDEKTDFNHTVYLCGFKQADNYYYVPCFDAQSSSSTWLDVVRSLLPLWHDKQRVWFVWQSKVLTRSLALADICIAGDILDVMLLGYIKHGPGVQKLSQLAYVETEYTIAAREVLLGQGAKEKRVVDIAQEDSIEHINQELLALSKLGAHYQQKLSEDEALVSLYKKVDRPLMQVLAAMENTGVLIDADELRSQAQEIATRIASLQTQAETLAGTSFNLASPKQLQYILYEVMKLPVTEKTPTGQPSTSESVLSRLAEQYPLPACILEHRSLAKLHSTYLDALPKMIHPHTGRVHSCFLQTSTSTGRLSSQAPNLQNIPVRTEEGRRIRHAFIPAPGYKLVSIDYSQIELRIMAHISQDSNLLKAFREGIDVHTQTASDIFSVTTDQVTAEQRRYAKVINFGLIYGMSAFGLAKQLMISRDEADGYISTYFSRYPGVLAYMDACKEQAVQYGYVETLLGRRLYFPDIKAKQAALRKASERAAINAPMQGTAAELIKLAMQSTHTEIMTYNFKARLIMQVHDELVFEIHEDFAATLVPKLATIMQEALALSVDLEVSTGVGDNWGVIH